MKHFEMLPQLLGGPTKKWSPRESLVRQLQLYLLVLQVAYNELFQFLSNPTITGLFPLPLQHFSRLLGNRDALLLKNYGLGRILPRTSAVNEPCPNCRHLLLVLLLSRHLNTNPARSLFLSFLSSLIPTASSPITARHACHSRPRRPMG